MFDVGFWELALIGAVALIIIGPERLPGAAHTAGLWVGKGRRMLRDVKADIDRELREQNVADLADLKKDIEDAGGQFKDAAEEISEEVDASVGAKDLGESLKQSFKEASPLGGDDQPKAAAKKTKDKRNGTKPGPAKNPARSKKTGKKTSSKETAKKTGKKSDKQEGFDMNYYIYENLVHKYAKIHKGTCSHCNDGKGIHDMRDGDRVRDEWHGPFDSLEVARRRQKSMLVKEKNECGSCINRTLL